MAHASKPTLLVLAAGMGSRFGGLKQITPMGPSGETLLDYSVYDALRANFGKVVFIIRHDFEEEFKRTVASKFESRIAVGYAFQELDALPAGFDVPEGRVKPWGTTHAIWCARDAVAEPFAVLNADDFYGRQTYAVIARHLAGVAPDSTDYAMVGFTLANTLSEHGTVSRGVCETDAAGRLTSIVEMKKIGRLADGSIANIGDDGSLVALTGGEPASMNFWGFTPRLFEQTGRDFLDFLKRDGGALKSECFIPETVGRLVRAGDASCRVLTTDSRWFGVTYPDDTPAVQANFRALVDAGEYPENLWA